MAAETLDPVLPARVQQKAQRVLDAAHENEVKLATAELHRRPFAALLTDVRGRGHVFDRGFVVYSKDAKCDLLGIARQKVDTCGAVSEPIAREMAQGALRRSQADIAVSITGFAGPGAGPTTRRAWSISPARAATAKPATARSISARSAATACASPRSTSPCRCSSKAFACSRRIALRRVSFWDTNWRCIKPAKRYAPGASVSARR